ncbi:hypothetical protein Hanom_Chr07g00599031 [Helianthus anomalus]
MKLECYQQYGGGYDRVMGGRPGFPDDRPRGRCGGRGYQGGPSGKHRFSISSKLQVLSFMFTPICRYCPLSQNLTSFVLNVSKFCTLCPFGQT